jgi:hypothetical protein
VSGTSSLAGFFQFHPVPGGILMDGIYGLEFQMELDWMNKIFEIQFQEKTSRHLKKSFKKPIFSLQLKGLI